VACWFGLLRVQEEARREEKINALERGLELAKLKDALIIRPSNNIIRKGCTGSLA